MAVVVVVVAMVVVVVVAVVVMVVEGVRDLIVVEGGVESGDRKARKPTCQQ